MEGFFFLFYLTYNIKSTTMKPNNQHSTKIWNLFATKIGSAMSNWNLTQWLPFSEETVTFVLNKPSFFGVVSITELTAGNLFIVSFQGFSWATHATTVLDADAMVNFIDKLGNETKVEGHRAPQDVNPTHFVHSVSSVN